MSILSTLWDKQSWSFAATSAGNGPFFATLPHSLPATTADAMLMQLVSIGGATSVSQLPQALAFGQNASISTIGYNVGSVASVPVQMGYLHSVVVHSIQR